MNEELNENETESETRNCKVCQCTEHIKEGEWKGVHLSYCNLCEICDRRFTKHDVQVFCLDRKFVACETCGLQESVSYYRLKYEQSRDSIENLKTQLNLFKSVMLSTSTMAAKADEPLSKQPSQQTIRQRLTGIENFTIDQMQFWLETYELYAREIATQLSKKASKEEIKQHLQDKTKKALQGEAKRKQKDESIERKPSVKLSPEDKAIKALMKSLNLNEAAAVLMYRGLNIPKGAK